MENLSIRQTKAGNGFIRGPYVVDERDTFGPFPVASFLLREDARLYALIVPIYDAIRREACSETGPRSDVALAAFEARLREAGLL